MPRYKVLVSYTQTREIGVWANDEETAMEKAEEVVLKWDGITDAEAMECEEE